MAYKYKIRSADIANGTFMVEFEGLPLMNLHIPYNNRGFLTGADLDAAIQNLYPNDLAHLEKVKTFNNGFEITKLVEESPATDQTSEQARSKRHAFLSNSDWTQLADSPLTAAKVREWADYRQQLRDVTKQVGFPMVVEWPTPPAK